MLAELNFVSGLEELRKKYEIDAEEENVEQYITRFVDVRFLSFHLFLYSFIF